MKRYAVRFNDVAQAEFDNAVLWYSQQSPETAERWYQKFQSALDSLATMPRIHPPARESERYDVLVRRLLFNPFRVLYHVVEPEDEAGDEGDGEEALSEGEVRILHVYHVARSDNAEDGE